jgi:opacity protein-like surface antigen
MPLETARQVSAAPFDDKPRHSAEGRVMRGVLFALASAAASLAASIAVPVASAQPALAADYGGGSLRGSSVYDLGNPQYVRWDGIYFGGHAGYSQAEADFADATKSLVAYSLRNLAVEFESAPSQFEVLGKNDIRAGSFGGFIGFNRQWDRAVLGIELNYNIGNFATIDAPLTPIRRAVPGAGNVYDVSIIGGGTLKITDFGSLKARAGYVMGWFMPYGTIGL